MDGSILNTVPKRIPTRSVWEQVRCILNCTGKGFSTRLSRTFLTSKDSKGVSVDTPLTGVGPRKGHQMRTSWWPALQNVFSSTSKLALPWK
ncbi:hypothetical protein CHS0354_034598 [Potamilus streckersoni]|uniref:Uncharacterized protein n=1 Tax=Potamilus streckersoni TaxID=2493646 RepID=A0AAE0STH8_9BIVA|nr:hypothetical protein CHS0354_034598 [Potamilus streckersoni]